MKARLTILKRSCLFFIVICLCRKTFAQQCGYDNYYLFVVNVHSNNNTDKIPNLRMYLVNEDDKPITTLVTYQEDKQWKHRYDTLFFWDNKKAKERAGGKPLLRQKFYNIGDNYVAAFRLNINLLQDPLQYPIYKLKVESGLNDNSGNLYPTEIFHLPIQKAVRICNNNVAENLIAFKPVETIDKKEFKPIDIILNEKIQQPIDGAKEEKNKLQYTVRFDFMENKNEPLDLTEYNIVNAKVYNTETGKLHQEIYIPSKQKSTNNETTNKVEFIDFYNRGIEEAKDFSVIMESWRDLEIKGYRTKRNYYIFNTVTKKYELDEELSKDDVFYYAPLKKMRKYTFEVTSIARIAYTYQLENNKWVLIDKTETLFNPTPPKLKYESKTCIIYKENTHWLPLKAAIGNNAKTYIKDTFWLYNACDDTIFITKVQSTFKDFFTINQTLLPKQNTPLIFNGFIESSTYNFTTNIFNCSLTFKDNYMVGFSITAPNVSNNATVFYNDDNSINYAIAKHTNKRFSNAIFTFPSGNLRAIGVIQDGDTSLKVGKWQFYGDGTIRSKDIIYSKEMLLLAFDTENGSQHTNFNIKVLENGEWKQPIVDVINYQKRFFITKEIDSVVAYTGTTSYAFDLNYKKLPANFSMQFYLLKPNERTVKISYYQTPFSILKNQYTIIPDYSKFTNKNKTSYQITDSILQSLQKKYPKIATVYLSRHQRGFDLSGLSYDEQNKVIKQLTKDTCIRFVCQLFTLINKDRITFCDNRVYAEINVEDADDFKRKASRLGFKDMQADIGSYKYWLTYDSKLIDETFFEAYEKLTQNKLVLSANFNSYHEVELDKR